MANRAPLRMPELTLSRRHLRAAVPQPGSWWLDLDPPDFYTRCREELGRMTLSEFGYHDQLSYGPTRFAEPRRPNFSRGES